MSAKLPNTAGSALLKKIPRSEYDELNRKVRSIGLFAEGFVGIRLRPYQLDAAKAIIKSVLARDGNSFVLLFARQSGKDELIANLILYLLARLGESGTSIVCAQPTFRPQTVNAMDRLYARAFQRPFFSLGGFHRTHGFIFEFLSARVSYLSAAPSASVVGATADRLLIINEAQDVSISVYDKRFAPMAASGNATRVFSGTAWTGDTLLDREMRAALELEKRDGLRRVFIVDGEHVASSNRLYARFLKQEIARLGRDHPLVRTQYFCQNVDARSGMFTPAHLALMRASASGSPESFPAAAIKSPAVHAETIAFLLDVAGQEESSTSYRSASSDTLFEPHSNQARDAVTLRIVEIDLSTLETLHAPTYRAVHLLQWTGQNHLTIFGQLKALAEQWRPQHIVIDATGVGEGLWALLDKAFPTRVIPVKFTQAVKSELGYGFLAIINTGRFRDDCGYDISRSAILTNDPAPSSPELQIVNRRSEIVNSPYAVPGAMNTTGYSPTRAEIDREYAACESEILIGPQKTMRWGVPAGRRDEDGRPIHDDIPVTDSLTAILDRLEWSIKFDTVIIRARDPLDEMSRIRRPRWDDV